jgi:hypothetical protein
MAPEFQPDADDFYFGRVPDLTTTERSSISINQITMPGAYVRCDSRYRWNCRGGVEGFLVVLARISTKRSDFAHEVASPARLYHLPQLQIEVGLSEEASRDIVVAAPEA